MKKLLPLFWLWALFLCPPPLHAQNDEPAVVVQMGHPQSIYAAAFSPDEKYMATGSIDRTIRLWEIATGKEMRTFAGHTGKINEIAFSPDGKHLVSASADKTVKLWEVHTGKLKYSIEEHEDNVTSVDYSPNGKWILSGSEDKTAILWEAATGKKEKRVVKAGFPIDRVRFDNEGSLALVATKAMLGFNQVIEIPSGKRQVRFFGGHVNSIDFTPDNKQLMTASVALALAPWPWEKSDKTDEYHKYQVINAINFKDTTEYNFWKPSEEYLETASSVGCFTKDGNNHLIAGNEKGEVLFFAQKDIPRIPKTLNPYSKLGQKMQSRFTVPFKAFQAHNAPITHILLSKNAKYVFTAATDGTMRVWDAKTLRKVRELRGYVDPVYGVAPSTDSRRLMVSDGDTTRHILDIASGQVEKLYYYSGVYSAYDIDEEADLFVSVKQGGSYIDVWRLSDLSKIHSMRGHLADVYYVEIKDGGKTLVSRSKLGKEYTWDLEEGRITERKNTERRPHISPDGTAELEKDHETVLMKVGSDVFELKHAADVTSMGFLPNGKYAYTSSEDGTVRLWNPKTGKEIVRYIITRNHETMVVTPDNYYYTTSKEAQRTLAFRYQERMYPFQQFDLKYNRPDLVISRIGYLPEALTNAYYQAYQKRLKRAGFTEEELSAEKHLPEISLKLSEEMDMKIATQERNLSFQVEAKDNKFSLKAIQVVINDVPVKEIPASGNSFSKKVEVDLSIGNNEVLVKAINEKGVASIPETFDITLDMDKKPDLYLVTIGVSEYQDSKQSLQYPDDDARNLARTLGESQAYGKVYQKQILNQEATKESILKLEEFLSQAGIDDAIIIFIAGHGLLDNDWNYIFGTYDIDFLQPNERGLAYTELEKLLKNNKSRKKVLLMDTCHSGEVDKDDLERSKKMRTKVEEDVEFRAVGDGVAYKEGLGLENVNRLASSLFSDIRLGTGATVISASGGAEVARETGRLKSGLFTHCFVTGLSQQQADQDGNEEISITEIQKFVTERVEQLSGGLQMPTSRAENVADDFRIW